MHPKLLTLSDTVYTVSVILGLMNGVQCTLSVVIPLKALTSCCVFWLRLTEDVLGKLFQLLLR